MLSKEDIEAVEGERGKYLPGTVTMVGPNFDSVCRVVDVPKFHSPEPFPQREMSEIAEDQAATLRHIAQTLADMQQRVTARSRIAEAGIQLCYHQLAKLENSAWWTLLLQAVGVIAFAVWAVVR